MSTLSKTLIAAAAFAAIATTAAFSQGAWEFKSGKAAPAPTAEAAPAPATAASGS